MNGTRGVVTAALLGAAFALVGCTVAELPPRSDGGSTGDGAGGSDTFADTTSPDAALPDTAADTAAPDAAGSDGAATDTDHTHDSDAAHTHDVEPDLAADTDATGVDPDLDLDWTCATGTVAPPACTTPVVVNIPEKGAAHISPPTPIAYDDTPPSSGNHRPTWAKWGEYTFCPAQRWVHNLEHGGAVFLYDPCADPTLIDALRAFAKARPDDAGGPFRWLLTPYPGLGDMVAVVTWEWSWVSPCVDETAIEQFLADHYRKSPEDVASDGGYETMWLSK
ncbi:MAG: DUF3105 domain-containing protein [Myxococcota bacterium]